MKGVVYKSYVRPAMQYGSEAWCLKEIDRTLSIDFMFMLGLNEPFGLWPCVEETG